MRLLKMPVWTLTLVLVTSSISQAKTTYAYVANHDSNTVSVINTSNNTVVTTIPISNNPWGIAVNQAGSLVYVTPQFGTAVSVISTSTNTVTASITVGTMPLGVAFAPNGKTAYVANAGSGTVSVINTGTKKVTATVTVGNTPYSLAVTPNGAFVYVANTNSNNVSVISTLTNKVVATVPVDSQPQFLAISPDGSLVYVPNMGSNDISVIQTADNTVLGAIGVDGAWGAAVSPDGHWLYATDYTSGAANLVTVIDTSTFAVSATIVVGQNPVVTSFSQDSAFAYVANPASNNVSVINTASKAVVGTINVGTWPVGVGVMGLMKVSTAVGGYVGDKGPATSAAIPAPLSTVKDSAGNLYIADDFGHRIRKVSPSGTITTYAGTGICGYNGESIAASKALLCGPAGLAFDPSGNLVEAEIYGNRIRKITAKGIISTIAGTGVPGYSGDGGPATSAQIGNPVYAAYDSNGNLYFSQLAHCVVRKIDKTGTITTVAGTGKCGYNGDGIPATTAQLRGPRGLAFDGNGNMYVTDAGNYRVRKIDSSGTLWNFAGTGNPGFSGDTGPATSANIGNPRGLTVYNGALYIGNAGSARVRYVDLSSNIINTYAGSVSGYDGDGHSLLSSEFVFPRDILFDSSGNPIITDPNQGRVRKATSGIVNTIAGGFIGDGNKATSAALVYPEALAIDKAGSMYIADMYGNRVRKVSGGKISTIAGTTISGYSGDGGPGTSATLFGPQGVAVDSQGNVFIADTYNDVIRYVNTSGTINPFAANANFLYLSQMATDSSNNVYVADNNACVIWKITPPPGAAVSIAAGVLNSCGYNGDGIAATTAQLNVPNSVAFDSGGNMYVADYGNDRVREVNTAGIINTIAGDGNCNDAGDGGPAASAELCPNSVTVDKLGTIYVADFSWGNIRKISGGIITTLAGTGSGIFGDVLFNGDGLWPLYTTFSDPVAVAVDSKGAVYELDDVDKRVRKIQ